MVSRTHMLSESAERSAMSCVSAGDLSVQPGKDNCYQDYTQRNAAQLAALLAEPD